MAAITAAMVKELRESTGAGMMECKKALTSKKRHIHIAISIEKIINGINTTAKNLSRENRISLQ